MRRETKYWGKALLGVEGKVVWQTRGDAWAGSNLPITEEATKTH